MLRRNPPLVLLIILLLTVLATCAACGSREKVPPEPQPVILEPGIQTDVPSEPAPAETPAVTPQPEPNAPAEEFTDLGRASTLDDLMANKEKIVSYYFEQTIHSTDADIFVKTWYKDEMMKIISSSPNAPDYIEYFDTKNLILVSYSADGDNTAMMMTLEPGDPDLPSNPLDYDYHQFRVLDTDSIDGQICRVMEGTQGEKLWVSTKDGFPLQREFTDTTTGERLTVTYENLVFNQVQDEDVAIPDDLIIYEF